MKQAFRGTVKKLYRKGKIPLFTKGTELDKTKFESKRLVPFLLRHLCCNHNHLADSTTLFSIHAVATSWIETNIFNDGLLYSTIVTP